MKERPIIFSGAMVRAIIEGCKTQTRRVVRGAVPEGSAQLISDAANDTRIVNVCPYGQPGDRLWVRETFVLEVDVDGEEPPFSDGRPTQRASSEEDGNHWTQPHYRATDPDPELDMGDGTEPHTRWTPSIFMPRWASRITLEITKVRVERVREISEQDAKAEGISVLSLQSQSDPSAWYQSAPGVHQGRSARNSYAQLWDSIYAKRGSGWEKNPWVWMLEFRTVPPTQPEAGKERSEVR